jgi:hypothetical protein
METFLSAITEMFKEIQLTGNLTFNSTHGPIAALENDNLFVPYLS